MSYIEVTPIIERKMQNMCLLPYPGHPKGCPNHGKKKGCPPRLPLFDEVYETGQVFAIYNIFDMAAHIEKMRATHPDWSMRQLTCCLYWQAGARKELYRACVQFAREHRGYAIAPCPEANGVNLTATMAGAGIVLEWPPRVKAYQIVLAAKIKANP